MSEKTKAVHFVDIRPDGMDKVTAGGVTVCVQHLPQRGGRAPQLRYWAFDSEGNVLPVDVEKL